MRIAIPVNGLRLSPHFGQSSAFLILDVTQEPAAITGRSELPVSGEGGCQSIPALLAQARVNVVLAGGMGAGAYQRLVECGIDTIAGIPAGDPEQIVMAYLSGELVPTGGLCAGHGDHEHGGTCHGHGESH